MKGNGPIVSRAEESHFEIKLFHKGSILSIGGSVIRCVWLLKNKPDLFECCGVFVVSEIVQDRLNDDVGADSGRSTFSSSAESRKGNRSYLLELKVVDLF